MILILLIFLVVGGVGLYFLMGNKKSGAANKDAAHTVEQLEKMTKSQLDSLSSQKAAVSNIESGKEIKLKDGKTYILTIDSAKLIKVDEKKADTSLASNNGKPVVLKDSSKVSTTVTTTPIKDRDGDGIPDDKDICPDDRRNKCKETVIVEDKPRIPADVKAIGGGVYAVKARSGGELIEYFHSRISSRDDIKSLGAKGRISSINEIGEINHFQLVYKFEIEGGTWVKFKVY
jgi:hypothetical protein